MKLFLIIVEGYVYLATMVAIFAAEVGLLLWGLWSRRPVVGLIAVFVTVPLIRSTFSAIRACFFKIQPPAGVRLARSQSAYRTLHEFVDDIRRRAGAAPIDAIVITGEFNASALVEWSATRLRRRRTIVLGFPVLMTLSVAELRAVIAHELAHFSSARGGFSSLVYRVRRSWVAFLAALDARLATPIYVYWIFRWYVRRLDVASAEVSRHQEFAADGVAAGVAGRRVVADALVALEWSAWFASDTFWPAIALSYQTGSELPRPYARMLAWNPRVASAEQIEAILATARESDDSHPSLRERVAHLGESARVPPSPGRTAGEELLGTELARLADQLDRTWSERHADEWRRRRADFVNQRAALERLAAVESPTAEERFKRAALMEKLESSSAALPIYESLAAEGYAAASLAAGRLLLDRMDPRGIQLLDLAMNQNETLVPEACGLLAHYYRLTDQELAARKCEWRATRHTTRARLAR